MRKLTIGLLGIMLLAGCQPARTPPPEAPPGALVQKTYDDMRSMLEAVNSYKADHGILPAGKVFQAKATLIQEGYLKEFPTPAPAIFTKRPMNYSFENQYDKMDSGPTTDAAIAIWGLRDEFCREFNLYYSSDSSGATIYDWEAHGKQYPGQAIGAHMKIYAIKFKSNAIDDCELNWVVEYR